MAKRFIDTGIFRKPSIRAMKPPYKALFIYLMCECDHAGVWDVELDVAATRLGMRIDQDKAIEELGGVVVSIDGGAKWWLRDFVDFQYGDLNPSNRVHASVIARLSGLGITPDMEAPSKPLASPIEGANENPAKQAKEAPADELVWPTWAGPHSKAKWSEFIRYRIAEHKARYKTTATEQKALDLACTYFPSGRMFVDALEHTMAKGWRFPVDPSEHKYPFSADKTKPAHIANPAEGWNANA